MSHPTTGGDSTSTSTSEPMATPSGSDASAPPSTAVVAKKKQHKHHADTDTDGASSQLYTPCSTDASSAPCSTARVSPLADGRKVPVCNPQREKDRRHGCRSGCANNKPQKCARALRGDVCVKPCDLLDQRPLCVPAALDAACTAAAKSDRGEEAKTARPGHCEPKIVEVSEITICEPKVAPESIDAPHLLFPRVRRCDREKCPRAPILLAPGQGSSFTVQGLTFTPLAGAVDTNCKAELAFVTFAPGAQRDWETNFGSDLFIVPLTGSLAVGVNCVPYTVPAGGFIYIKAGSPYLLSNMQTPSTTAADMSAGAGAGAGAVSALIGWLGPGGMGRFSETAAYETAVSGSSNMDPCVLRALAEKFCVFSAPSQVCPPLAPCGTGGEWAFLHPGSVRFVPAQTPGCACGSWGLKCCQLLVLSTAIATPLPPGQRAKTSATVGPEDTWALLAVPALTPTEIPVTAAVIRDPRCGTAEVVANPTVNGAATATLTTGQSYSVFFDVCRNDVLVCPLPASPMALSNGIVSV